MEKEYAQLQQEYAEASAGYKPLREDLLQLRKIQHWVDVAREDRPQEKRRETEIGR